MTWKLLATVVLGIGLVGTAGCGTPAAQTSREHKDDKDHKDGDESHEHGAGPHQGIIFDFGGGKYHGEFKPDHAKKEATVWILGLDEKTPAPVKADRVRLVISNTTPKIEIDLLPADRDAEGKAHTFTGKHDALATEQEYKGLVRFNVGDTQYSGDFEEKAEKK